MMEKQLEKQKKNGKTKQISLTNARKYLSIDFKDLKLKAREIRFVAAFCMTWNQQKAYEMAGYKTKSPNSLAVNASKLLNSTNILTAIERYVKIAIEPYKYRLNLMLMEVWYKRAFYDITVFYHADGHRKELDEIPREWLVCIDGIEMKRYGKEPEKNFDIDWKLCSRTDALREIRAVLEIAIGSKIPDNMPGDEREKIQMIFKREYEKLGIKQDVIPFEPMKKAQ